MIAEFYKNYFKTTWHSLLRAVSDISHQSNKTIAILPLLVFIGIFTLFHLTTKITFKYQKLLYYSLQP